MDNDKVNYWKSTLTAFGGLCPLDISTTMLQTFRAVCSATGIYIINVNIPQFII